MRKLLSKYTLAVLWTMLIVSCSLNSYADQPALEFAKANNFYQQKNFDSAAAIYEQLIAQQYFAPEVYYNLGNCYYRTNHVAKAILNYERALKYKPDDEDILFNIKIAQLKIVDKIEVVPEIFYVRWMKKLSAAFTTDQWATVTVGLVWCIFIALSIYLLSLRIAVKRSAFIIALIILVLTISSWLITRRNYVANKVNKNAVVMSMSVYVKSSPDEQNTDLFILHEGTKVDVLDEYEDWLKIKIANGSVGWVKHSDVEEI